VISYGNIDLVLLVGEHCGAIFVCDLAEWYTSGVRLCFLASADMVCRSGVVQQSCTKLYHEFLCLFVRLVVVTRELEVVLLFDEFTTGIGRSLPSSPIRYRAMRGNSCRRLQVLCCLCLALNTNIIDLGYLRASDS
jgi:hypothetical protein